MFIKIFNKNGVEIQIPTPARGLNYLGQQLVDDARNTNAVVVAQPINRRLMKLDNVQWNYLSDADWRKIRQAIEGFIGFVEFYDDLSGTRKRMQFYWGDYSAEPFMIDPVAGTVKSWSNCKCNIIDMGLPLTSIE